MKNLGGGFNARRWLTAAALAAFVAGCGSGDDGKIFGSGGAGLSGSGAGPGPAGAAPVLGTAAGFAGLAGGGAGMTNQGIFTVISGAGGQPVSIGTTGASTLVTGFHDNSMAYTPPNGGPATGCTYTETTLNIGAVDGTINTDAPPPTLECAHEGTAATKALADQAAADALAAFNDLAGRPGATDPGQNLGGLTLAPGVYAHAAGDFLITGSDLTLDAGGNTEAVWVFQMANTLTVGDVAPSSVILAGGALPGNVFWQVGSSATINGAGGGTMAGTIISSAGTSFSTAGNPCCTTLNGRALALNASVTLVNTVINVPAP
ncbi:MAG: ice-binding family protein [Burkholderiales bacterium]